MVASMTAFARLETSAWVWEIRSVNHRFLDLSFFLPTAVHAIEPDLRACAKNLLNRGRVEATLTKSSADTKTTPTIDDHELKTLLANAHEAQVLIRELNDTGEQSNSVEFDVFEVLRWPGVLKRDGGITEDIHKEICHSFVEVVKKLVESRNVEGNSLRQLFNNRLTSIQQIVCQLSAVSELQIGFIREKLSQRIQKLGANVDPNRVAQEVALLAQRADVNEEIDRLNVHLSEFESCMKRAEPQGRRLGFIVQEMARESNTLSAKLAPPEAVNLTVDLKVLIDQIREQVQNVE